MSFNFSQVIGLVGPKAAGKTTAARHLVSHHHFYHYPLSAPIQAEGKKRGYHPVPTKVLQDIGDEWRRTQGPAILITKALALARRQKHHRLVIDGIRNPGEIHELATRIPPNHLLLIGIKAPVWSCYHRVKTRGRTGDQFNYHQFLTTHHRDMGQKQPADGQQVAQCLKLIPPDHLIINHDGIPTFLRQLEKLYQHHLSQS